MPLTMLKNFVIVFFTQRSTLPTPAFNHSDRLTAAVFKVYRELLVRFGATTPRVAIRTTNKELAADKRTDFPHLKQCSNKYHGRKDIT
jgi:hypothetical protein